MVQEEEIRAPAGGPTGVSGAALNRSLSGQRMPQYQQAPGMAMAGRPPTAGVANPHYSPQFMPTNAVASAATASPMMMAQQRPGQMQQQQQQRPSAAAQANQIRAGNYLQQAQQYPPTQFVHHIASVPMNNMNAARPGVQGSIAPIPGTQHYGNMQNLTVAQQHNMQARQKPNPGQTPGTQYIGGVTASQQQALGAARQGVSIASQQQQQQQALQQQQQQQALQQQQMNAQRLGPQQQQAMARQAQGQQMLQSQGNTILARGPATGAQMQGLSSGGQQQQVWQQGKPAQYQQQQPQHQQQQQLQQQQQQQQPQQQARPQMVTTSLATTQARPATPGAAQANNALPSSTAVNTEPLDATGSILGKRSIQDLLAQIDPRERLDPDVEEVFLEIADDFIENVASFSCKIAQHRKSKILEAKDVLLHLDKAYNITVPGFGGDEYRSYKRPTISETHKQRLAVVRKSAAAGQAAAESKTSNLLTTAPATNASTPVKSGPAASPTPSPGMPRIPRV